MIGFTDTTLLYFREGVAKNGKNAGREYYILVFKEDDRKDSETEQGYDTHKVFVFKDDINFDLIIGAPYQCVFARTNTGEQLVMVQFE